MSRLKRKAYKDLIVCLYALTVGGVSFIFLIRHFDETSVLRTFHGRIMFLLAAVVLGIWVSVGQFIMKRRNLKGLDERELLIYENAQMISDSIFSGLCLAGFMGLFGWFGPKIPIPIFVPVLMFFGFAVLAGIVKPVVILIQLKMESPNE